MRKFNLIFTLILIGIILHFGATISYSSYLVGFNNGRTISVEDYRVEGGQIFLYLNGGVVKFSRSEIKSISEEKDQIREGKKEERNDVVKDAPKTPVKTALARDPEKKGEGIEDYRKKKADLSERLDEAKKIYFETSDKSDKDRARKVMISFSKELFALEEEVMQKNNGVLPGWWKE